MATYYDEHADLALIQETRVAVLGDDAEAVVYATVLRDSGVDVHIGTSMDSEAMQAGEIEGFLCIDAASAVGEADLVVVTRGDAAVGPLLDAARPHLVSGTTILVTEPVGLHLGRLRLPTDGDVVVVAPLAPAAVLEREFTAGRGVPAVVAVANDASGAALQIALSYAKAIGATRAGAIGATVEAAAETTLFGQYAVVGGALDGLLAGAFEVLSEAGHPRDLAYVACVHSLRLAVERAYGAGDDAPVETALEATARRAGGMAFARDDLRATLDQALADVRSGQALGDETASSEPGGSPTALTEAGDEMRRLMPWIPATERDARHAR